MQGLLRASLHSAEPLLNTGASGGHGAERTSLDTVGQIVDVLLRCAQLARSKASDLVEGALGFAGSLDDQRLDAGDDLARRVKPLMRDLVEDRAVALVANAGKDRHRTQADKTSQLVVVEPGEVVDGAAAADDDDRIGQIRVRPGRQRMVDHVAD